MTVHLLEFHNSAPFSNVEMNGSSGPPIKVEKDDTSTSNKRSPTDSAAAVNRKEERQVPANNNERDRSTDSTEMDSLSPQQLVHAGELSYQEITINFFNYSHIFRTDFKLNETGLWGNNSICSHILYFTGVLSKFVGAK